MMVWPAAINMLLFVGLPYITLLLMVAVPIYRLWINPINWDWTTRSSGFFGNQSIGIASPLLHWGLFFLFAGHIIGILGVALGFPFVGIFFWMGGVGGVLAFVGSVIALVRRLYLRRMRVMSTPQDYVIHAFLLVMLGLGLYPPLFEGVFGVSFSIFPWFISIFQLSPDISLIAEAPLVNRIHVVTSMLFFAYFPFTKLVHLWSFPFRYFTRPYISMRRLELPIRRRRRS